MLVVFFDSYESAMENSNLPETAEFAESRCSSSTAHPPSTTSTSSKSGPEEHRWLRATTPS